jgi:predicted transcriptional regulator
VTPTSEAWSKSPICSFKYRDRHQIVSDILKTVSKSNEGRKKTQIMQAAHINTVQADRYLEFCIINGYVLADGFKYRLSGKGLMFLENAENETLRVQWRR